MTSEIRANTLKNRVGLGTIEYSSTGPIVSGIVTANGADINGDIDVDGHTNLDNVSIAGVTTMTGVTNLSSELRANGNIRMTNAGPKISFIDSNHDSDFHIENADGSFEIRDVTNGADRVRIASNGTISLLSNVNVSGDLDVDGHTNLDNVSIAGVSTFTGRIDASDNIAITSGNRLYFGNSDVAFIKGEHGGSGYLALGANSEHVRITRAGNVGISTAAPSEKLQVKGDVLLGSTGGDVALKFEYSDHQFAKIVGNGRDSSGYGDIDFYTSTGSGVSNLIQRMTIRADGKVGIDQDTPRALLSLGGTLDAQKMLLYDNDGGTNEKYGFGIQSNELRQFAGGSARLTFGHISSSDGSTYSERLSINSSGMVVFKGGSGNVDQVKIESQGGGTGLYIVNFQGVSNTSDTGRLGVGKDDNVLIFTNASSSQISNFAIGNTDSIPLVFSTHNKKRLEITGSGIVQIRDNQGVYTNTVQSHSGEAGFITHYTARTTQGGDKYRRMLDIASGGANPHGSAMRFLTSDDDTNPATCVERMRILNNGGVFIGAIGHNNRYMHAQAPGLLTVQNGARVNTGGANVFAAPKGGFCDQSRYNLESQLVSFSNSNLGVCQARNGQVLTINDSRNSWSHYNNLPNYLLGHAATDNINNTDFTLTLYADMTVFMIRTSGWNGINDTYNFPTNWTQLESGGSISPADELWVTTVPRGAHSWDNNSAMYIFVL